MRRTKIVAWGCEDWAGRDLRRKKVDERQLLVVDKVVKRILVQVSDTTCRRRPLRGGLEARQEDLEVVYSFFKATLSEAVALEPHM